MPRKFTEDERQQFLAGTHIAVLSVAADKGRPPASAPIWYAYQPGGDILINTGDGGRKVRLIEQAGVVTVTVQREELPYQYVVVEGTVVGVERPASRENRLAIATRYLGPEGGEQFVASMGDDGSVLLHIRPDRWLTADFSTDV